MARQLRPVPDDFATWAPREGDLKLRKRYGARYEVITRWRALTGLRYAGAPPMPKKPSKGAVARLKARRRRWVAQERIEDLDDGFDLARSLGVRCAVGGEW